MIIGIGGVSRSGKSVLSRFLKKQLGERTIEIHLDDYPKHPGHWDFFTRYPFFYLCEVHKSFDVEHPIAIDFNRLYNDILECNKDNKVVIVEGFLATYDPRIKKLFDKYIHITLSKNVFTQRRMKDFRCNLWYANHVWKSFMKHGNNYTDLNHIVVNGDEEIDKQTVLRFIFDP
jgi:uridine kinase